jgi:predicted acetyltransferase
MVELHSYNPASSTVRLVRPDVIYRDSFLAGLQEITTDPERRSWCYLRQGEVATDLEASFPEYVAALLAREETPPEGFVTDTVYWGILGDEVVGRISLRHSLNEFLRNQGGHIGCIIRPSQRGHGLAGALLRQLLSTARAQEIGRLLLTCDDGNLGSEKTIRNAGGVFEDLFDPGDGQPPKKRFWIDLGNTVQSG